MRKAKKEALCWLATVQWAELRNAEPNLQRGGVRLMTCLPQKLRRYPLPLPKEWNRKLFATLPALLSADVSYTFLRR